MQSENDSIHFNIEIQNEGEFHFQKVDSELNRDSIIFTASLAKLSGLNTVIYNKYTSSSGDMFVYSQKFDEGKTWRSGDELLKSYYIEDIERAFSEIDPIDGSKMFNKYCEMIILDIFTLNCDRTHNNWFHNGKDILLFDYNFNFGSAQLLHGLNNVQLISLLSTGINDYSESKNKYLQTAFEKKKRLDINDLIN